MVTPIVTSDAIIAEHPPHKVYVRQRWADPWVEIEHLYCDWLEYACGPEIGRAQLSWRYGRGLRPGEPQYQDVDRTDLVGWYVRVEVFAPLPDVGAESFLWIGKISEEEDRRDGALRRQNGDRLASGNQSLVAYDMAIELGRVHVHESIVQDTADPLIASVPERTIGRAIGFNLGQGESRDLVRANATAAESEGGPEVGDHGTKIFCEDFDDAVKWDAAEILRYLLAYFSPSDGDEETIPYALAGQVECLEWLEPEVQAEGKTVLQILNELVNRRRLAGYRIDVDEIPTPNRVDVVLFSLAEADIELNAETTFPANDQQKSLDFDRAFDILDAPVRDAAGHRYDQIIVRGERMTSMITVSSHDETLVADWTAAEEALYEAGASDVAGYSDLSEEEQDKANARAREDDALQRVYSWFRIPKDWDGFVKKAVPLDAGEDPVVNAAFPKIAETGLPIETETRDFWRAGLRLEPRLPIFEHHTYTGPTASERLIEPEKDVPEGSIAEKLPPIVAIQTVAADAATDTDAEFELVDKLATDSIAGEELEQRDFSCHVRVQDHTPGIALKVAQAGRQHMIAKADFAPLSEDEDGILDWNVPDGNLIATVHLKSDDHVTQVYPPDDDPSLVDLDFVRQLTIDVPDAELIYAPPLTVVAINKGKLERTQNLGSWIRDDRDRLTRIAKLAHAWYGVDRQILDLTYRQVSGLFRVGDLITEIGAEATLETINTIITFVRIDLVNGTTQVKTQFAELDVLAF